MNEIMTEYKETAALLAHSFIGCEYTTKSDNNITTARLWLRDTETNGTSRMLRNIRIIDKANETWHDINSAYPVIPAAIGIETAINCAPNLLVAKKYATLPSFVPVAQVRAAKLAIYMSFFRAFG